MKSRIPTAGIRELTVNGAFSVNERQLRSFAPIVSPAPSRRGSQLVTTKQEAPAAIRSDDRTNSDVLAANHPEGTSQKNDEVGQISKQLKAATDDKLNILQKLRHFFGAR